MHPPIPEDRMEAASEPTGDAPVDGHLHALTLLAANTVAVDPDHLLAVGPFEQLDIGAGDPVEAHIQKPSFRSGFVDEVELVLDTEAIGEADRASEDADIFAADALGHLGLD